MTVTQAQYGVRKTEDKNRKTAPTAILIFRLRPKIFPGKFSKTKPNLYKFIKALNLKKTVDTGMVMVKSINTLR